ncbi:type II secretion system major pseudopilin GspG [Candidatus Poribacteria bacterium]|nr:type II secretion system major pseudopilin GspG [Candidatus Poribacteria bacterium]
MRNERGLSSLQILAGIVVVLIVLAVFVAPRILKQSERAMHAKASEQIEMIGIALDLYAKDNGDYPTTEQGLKALWQKPEVPPIPINWNGPYIDVPITKDPWGRDYIYIRPGLKNRYTYDLISYGSDGMEGGKGTAEDITNWVNITE